MIMIKSIYFFIILILFTSCQIIVKSSDKLKKVSGIYPHLAFYNNEDTECGIGAVVPWADRLWVITYGASNPFGSSDKLYEITPGLKKIIRPESIGGTHANRMIHRESNQLFIGLYAIDENRNVRVIHPHVMPGRHTGIARHLFNPADKIYYGAMEGGFYEVDVKTLQPEMLYKDASLLYNYAPLPVQQLHDLRPDVPMGWDELLGFHGKGLYSGQGVMVYSNNGEPGHRHFNTDIEAGSLSEWDGNEWKLVRRDQFCEVTGPGCIYGNEYPDSDPIWATGWDHKSVILGVRNPFTGWDFFRLPKASNTYDGLPGNHTEWPRIRNIGTERNPDYLMTMHGMFWHFPGSFTADNSGGIRPRSAYLTVLGDFARWNDRLVFGCDISAHRQFSNIRKHKNGIVGPGQSNSNLWFTSLEKPDQLGPTTASGAVWHNEQVNTGEPSEPFLFAGWEKRSAWIKNDGKRSINFVFEVDKSGDQTWIEMRNVLVRAGETKFIEFSQNESGEWIRVKANSPTVATVSFNYTGERKHQAFPSPMFEGLSGVNDAASIGGLLYGLGDDRYALGISAVNFGNGLEKETGYYELDKHLNLVKKDDPETNRFIKEKFAIPKNVIDIQESSVLIIDDAERRWRLPFGQDAFKQLTNAGHLRICREVITERDLFHSCGTFYELPAESADGFAKIRPVASHNFRIHDYASYRGLLVMTGINPDAKTGGDHIVRSSDGQAAVWVGAIDDLWELGKPTGHGGPWKNNFVRAGEQSDPYLFGFYDQRKLTLFHGNDEEVKFTIQFDPVGHGPWMTWREVTVAPDETFEYEFPEEMEARWIRFNVDKSCIATAWLEYR